MKKYSPLILNLLFPYTVILLMYVILNSVLMKNVLNGQDFYTGKLGDGWYAARLR